ncbi:MAG: DUF2207 domain-containing protein [Acidobacteriota bacterium]
MSHQKRKQRGMRTAGAALGWMLLLGLTLSGTDKDFYFPRVKINVAVHASGDFTVTEDRTYAFQGSFSWAQLWIPLRVERAGRNYDISVENFSITDENGRSLRTEISRTSRQMEVKWHYSAADEQSTFRIRYTVKNGIAGYPEVSELYWQVIGDGWDRPTRDVEVTVLLPVDVPAGKDFLVYGHGPLSGRSEIIDRRTARFTASNLPAFQFVEIRMAWPSGLVSGNPSRGHTFDSIRTEEARFVQETIAAAERARERQKKREQTVLFILGLWGIFLVLGTAAWLFYYLRVWKKSGREYDVPARPDYFRDLPSSLPPALVEILLHQGGGISPRSFTATLFDMARRGYVEMDDRRVDKKRLFGSKEVTETLVVCKKTFSEAEDLLPFEKRLLRWLFDSFGDRGGEKGSVFTIDVLKKYLETFPQVFQKWFRAWDAGIKEEAKKRQFNEPESLQVRKRMLGVSIAQTVLTLNPIVAVLSAVLIPKITRRSREWGREYELWRALKRFLDDFSDFKELPPEAYKLWESYLVFGIVFGNAKKIIRLLPVILKDERAVLPAWYAAAGTGKLLQAGGITDLVKGIESAATTIERASTSAAHYSSGSGGGFSSGGGGGGGGGGGSAG